MSRISLLLPALTLTLAASAAAETATADCDGWTVTATSYEGGGSFYAEATAYLYQWNGGDWALYDVSVDEGLLVDTFTDYSVGFVSILYLGNNWDGPLPPGEYRVVIDGLGWQSDLNGDWQDAEEARLFLDPWSPSPAYTREEFFSCDGPAVDARTPGYWKNHPGAWPMASLQLGDDVNATFQQACLLELLDRPTRGDLRVKLAHHLIAAKLNLANGADAGAITGYPAASSTIVDTIAAADAALASADIGCSGFAGAKPQGAAKQQVVAIKDALDAFNNNFE